MGRNELIQASLKGINRMINYHQNGKVERIIKWKLNQALGGGVGENKIKFKGKL